MQDAYPVCAFSSGRDRSSVLGVRLSALNPVPGIRDQAPGTGTRQGNRAIRQ